MNAPVRERQHLIGPAATLSAHEEPQQQPLLLVEQPRPPATTTVDPERLIMYALERSVPMEQLEKLLAMRADLIAAQAKRAFYDALSKFQRECPVIGKRKSATIRMKDRQTGEDSGKSYTYKYAPLEDIVAEAGPILAENGLSFSFTTEVQDKGAASYVVATCHLHHIGGHTESESDFTAPIDKTARMNDTQKYASALMYAKRYAFCNATGVITGNEDDDGDTGGAHSVQPQREGRTYDAESSGALPAFPDDKFHKELPTWKTLLTTKKRTLDEIKRTVTTRYRFTDAQLQKLNAAAGVS